MNLLQNRPLILQGLILMDRNFQYFWP